MSIHYASVRYPTLIPSPSPSREKGTLGAIIFKETNNDLILTKEKGTAMCKAQSAFPQKSNIHGIQRTSEEARSHEKA